MWQSVLNRVTRHPSYLYNLLKRNAPLRSPDLPITLAGARPRSARRARSSCGGSGQRPGGTIAVLARRAP